MSYKNITAIYQHSEFHNCIIKTGFFTIEIRYLLHIAIKSFRTEPNDFIFQIKKKCLRSFI